MYRVIKGVSFAAAGKHISRVNIPVFAEAETLAYLDAVPTLKASLSRTPNSANLTPYLRYRALNDFVKNLKTNGIFAKLDYLGLPFLGQVEGGVSVNNPAFNCNLPTDVTIATYSSKGVKFLKGWEFPMNFRIDNTAPISQTFGAYNTLARPTAQGDNLSIIMANSAAYLLLGRRVSGGLYSGLNPQSSLLRLQTLNRSYLTGLMLGVVTPTTTSCLIDSEWVTATQTFVTASSKKFVIGGHTAGSTTAILDAPLGTIVFAQPLSETEAKILSANLDTLLAAFAVI